MTLLHRRRLQQQQHTCTLPLTLYLLFSISHSLYLSLVSLTFSLSIYRSLPLSISFPFSISFSLSFPHMQSTYESQRHAAGAAFSHACIVVVVDVDAEPHWRACTYFKTCVTLIVNKAPVAFEARFAIRQRRIGRTGIQYLVPPSISLAFVYAD